MKVKISANSHLPHLENVASNVSYGYSSFNPAIGDLTENQFWQIKVISHIDKFFSKKNLSETHKEVTNGIISAAQFLENHIAGVDHIDDMRVHINVKSYTNMAFKTVFYSLPLSSLDGPFMPSFDDKAAHINFANNKISIGTDFFSKQHDFNLGYYLAQEMGLDKAIGFVVYHEASHSFQYNNTKIYGFGENSTLNKEENSNSLATFMKFDDLSKIMTNEEECTRLNTLLQLYDDQSFSPVKPNLMKNLYSLGLEIYADAGAILMQRNADFINGTYSLEKTASYVQCIIDSRNLDHKYQLTVHENDQHKYTSNFNHFTTPGIEYIKDNLINVPNRALTMEEIHSYSHNALTQGVARVLITTARANPENEKQIRTLCNLNTYFNAQGNLAFSLPSSKDPIAHDSIYFNEMKNLESLAGSQWSADFKNKCDDRMKLNKFNNMLDIWNIGLIPTEPCSVIFKKSKNSFVETSSDIKDKPTGFMPKKFNAILSDIGSLREKAFSNHSDNTIKNKMP